MWYRNEMMISMINKSIFDKPDENEQIDDWIA